MRPLLIIQGLDTYADKLRELYGNDVLFSTWKGAGDFFFNTLYLDIPTKPGRGHVNLQFYGAMKAAEKAIELGYDTVVKIRSDFAIKPVDKFLDLIDTKQLNFLAYHNWDGGYLCDYIIGGPARLLVNIWNYTTGDDMSRFAERVLYDRLKLFNVGSVNYLLPKMKEAGIDCYAYKWQRDIVQSMSVDNLFTFPEKLPYNEYFDSNGGSRI